MGCNKVLALLIQAGVGATLMLNIALAANSLSYDLPYGEYLPEQIVADPSTSGSPQFLFQKDLALLEKKQATKIVVVDSVQTLLAALSSAEAGQVVRINKTALIDVGALDKIVIPGNVTLDGGGGAGGVGGARLFTQKDRISSLLVAGGEGVRITGLRIIGPDPNYRKTLLRSLKKQGQYYSVPTSLGISSRFDNLIVDNCELSGWGYAAIKFHGGATGGWVVNNYIHHNQRWGLGYGVVLDNARTIIEHNVFDYNRHAIAGSGVAGTSYEARYNVVLENSPSHAFDMHGGRDRKDGTDLAGELILIHHNRFDLSTEAAIYIRGRPEAGAYVYRNCFAGMSIIEVMGKTNLSRGIALFDNTLNGCG